MLYYFIHLLSRGLTKYFHVLVERPSQLETFALPLLYDISAYVYLFSTWSNEKSVLIFSLVAHYVCTQPQNEN